jgi:hypothetical protein
MIDQFENLTVGVAIQISYLKDIYYFTTISWKKQSWEGSAFDLKRKCD